MGSTVPLNIVFSIQVYVELFLQSPMQLSRLYDVLIAADFTSTADDGTRHRGFIAALGFFFIEHTAQENSACTLSSMAGVS